MADEHPAESYISDKVLMLNGICHQQHFCPDVQPGMPILLLVWRVQLH